MTHAIVIGGGIAGCSTAYALARRGVTVTLIERHASLAQEASGNPLAMLYPKFSIVPNASSELALQGYRFTLALLQAQPEVALFFNQCGLLQLAFNANEQSKQAALAQQSDLKPYLRQLNKGAASEIAGIVLKSGSLFLADSGWLKPAAFCAALSESSLISTLFGHAVSAIVPHTKGWQITLDNQQTNVADMVVICNANAIKQFKLCQQVPITPVRGQINYFQQTKQSQAINSIICTDHYLSPAVDGWHTIGTSFSPNDLNPQLSDRDAQQNMAAIQAINPAIHQEICQQGALPGRVAWRSATPDYLPLAGQLIDTEKLLQAPPRYNTNPADLPWLKGLYLNAGHGSKGMITAPICAELIASFATQNACPLSLKLASQLNPSRFLLKKLGLKQLAQSLYSSHMA